MSQATAALARAGAAPARRNTPIRRNAPHLEALPQASRRARPRMFYASVAVATVMVIVMAQLTLTIGVSQGAYKIESLQRDNVLLSRQLQQASETVQTLSSPQNLAANADALGMVSDGTPVYLRLSDGAVIGSPAPASGAAAPASAAALVPNSLTSALDPVVGPKPTSKKAAASGDDQNGTGSGAPDANDGAADSGPVPWTGALPAPDTH